MDYVMLNECEASRNVSGWYFREILRVAQNDKNGTTLLKAFLI